MKLDKIFQILVPKDRKFYPLFKEASSNLVSAAVLLTEMVRNNNNVERAEYVSKIKVLEHVGDDYTKTLLKELNRTFITPFDREDILELANRLDGVVDLINTTAKRIVLYNLTEIPSEFIEMADLIHTCAKEIDSMFNGLKDVQSLLQYKDSCRLIHDIESQSDDINHEYLAKIFQEETNGIELIKKKDILTSLEKAIDRCEDVADVIQTIIIKNA
jgi:predicted phosphate transport protein (TIGR00153 family)